MGRGFISSDALLERINHKEVPVASDVSDAPLPEYLVERLKNHMFHIDRESFTLEEFNALAKALNTTSVDDFILEDNPQDQVICQEGAETMLKALKINPSITKFRILGIPLRTEGYQVIKDILLSNNHLQSFSFMNEIFDDQGFNLISEGLAGNQTLQEVWFESCAFNSKRIIALSTAIQSNSTLVQLSLCNDNTEETIGKSGIKALSAAIKTNQTLTSLTLRLNRKEKKAQELIEALEIHHSLKNLEFHVMSEEEASGFANIIKNNTSLTSLKLTRSGGDPALETKTVGEIRDALKENNTLKELDCRMDTGDGGKMILSSLKENNILEELTLNYLDNEGAVELIDLLRTNTGLKRLTFNRTNIDNQHAQDLALALQNNANLKFLNFGSNWNEPIRIAPIDHIMILGARHTS